MLKSIIFCVVWFIQMTIIIYFTMEMYGELKPNPFIALGGLVSFYLSYRVFKKIDLSKVFDFLSKREDKTISHQEEPMKKEFSEPAAVNKGNKILFMPKKIFYTVSTLCLLSLLVFVVWGVRFKGDFHFECSPNSIFFNVKYDYVRNSTNTVLVDGIRYNKSDMTLFSGEYTEATSGDVYHTYYAYSYQNGLKHGYSYVWQKEGDFYDGYYTFRGKYKKGLYHGLIEVWYDNGQLKSRGNYVDGQKHGLVEEWYSNGQLMSRGNYVDGQVDGIIQKWAYEGRTLYAISEISEPNDEALQELYRLFKSDGYIKSIEDFKMLMSSNQEAVEVMYNLARDEGYKKSIEDFKILVGFNFALDDLHKEFLRTGYTGSKADFKKLLQTNADAFSDGYRFFTSSGYIGSHDDFAELMGVVNPLKIEHLQKTQSFDDLFALMPEGAFADKAKFYSFFADETITPQDIYSLIKKGTFEDFDEFLTSYEFDKMIKLKNLYHLYREKGLISQLTHFDEWVSADSEMQVALFIKAKSRGLFEKTTLEDFQAVWPSVYYPSE